MCMVTHMSRRPFDQVTDRRSRKADISTLEYPFVVSNKEIHTADDSQPTEPLDSARLSLMTCSGTWDPVTRNYSYRLWITTELPAEAASTIAAYTLSRVEPVL